MQRKLTRKFPGIEQYEVKLAGSLVNQADFLCAQDQLDESQRFLGEAIAILTRMVKKQPDLREARVFLFNAYYNRVGSFKQLKNYSEALADCASALTYADSDRQKKILKERRKEVEELKSRSKSEGTSDGRKNQPVHP